MLKIQVGVDLGGRDILMPEQLLNRVDVRAVLKASCTRSRSNTTAAGASFSTSVSGITIGLTLRLCGAIGVIKKFPDPGYTIGPPQLSE